MKYIEVQPLIKVVENDETGVEVPFTFHSWLTSAVYSNHLFGKGLKHILQGAKIITVIKDQQDAAYIELEDDDYAKLKESIDICQWIPRVAMTLIQFHEAVNNAADKRPAAMDADTEGKQNGDAMS